MDFISKDNTIDYDGNSTYFTYDALQLLSNDVENILSQYDFDEVFLIPFKINLNGSKPFNTIMLLNENSYSLKFPSINISSMNEDKTTFITMINCYLYALLMSDNQYYNYNILNYDFETFVNIIDFKGLYLNEGKLFAFIDLSKLDISLSLINKTSTCWFALMDEIINKYNVCNISIDLNVSDFFLNNNEFIFFSDENKEHIEIPSSVYTGTYEKKLYFTYIFGNTSSDNNAIVGSGYYFTNYMNAIRQGGWSKDYNSEYRYDEKITDSNSGKYNKGGIIRYALFLANCLINNDGTTIVYDDNWKENYDSIYLGNAELTDDTPSLLYVIKDYYNHIPLSYHYIDKRMLDDKFDENINYQIM